MLEILKEIDWNEGAYKAAFSVVAIILLYAVYHGLKFFGKRLIAILEGGQKQIGELTELAKKMDTQIELIKQEQKFQNDKLMAHEERFLRHDEKFDELIRSFIKATNK